MNKIENHIKAIIKHIGDDPERQGLKETPNRVYRMWKEIFRGYDISQKPKITVFDNGVDGLEVNDIVIDTGDFYSMCEHHIMPFFGRYMFAYVPHEKGKIIGISKIARVVDYCSARLQIQERLCKDVVDMINDALSEDSEYPPKGIAIIMEGEHLCKTMRGVKKKGKMTSFYAIGCLNTQDKRNEIIRLFKDK